VSTGKTSKEKYLEKNLDEAKTVSHTTNHSNPTQLFISL
jgi:hypothetical protein